MDDLAADLMLLAANTDGTLDLPPKLRFGLSGSELVRLAAARRVQVTGDRVVVLDTAPTGDPLLDEALTLMTGRKAPSSAKAWVALGRRRLVERYLARLAEQGIVRADRRKLAGLIPVTRWVIIDTARTSRARAALRAVAEGTGTGEPAQAALAGLAFATGLASYVFPGVEGVPARKRLKDAAVGDPAADAAVRAATDAAVMAAVTAATAAATSAAMSAGGFHLRSRAWLILAVRGSSRHGMGNRSAVSGPMGLRSSSPAALRGGGGTCCCTACTMAGLVLRVTGRGLRRADRASRARTFSRASPASCSKRSAGRLARAPC